MYGNMYCLISPISYLSYVLTILSSERSSLKCYVGSLFCSFIYFCQLAHIPVISLKSNCHTSQAFSPQEPCSSSLRNKKKYDFGFLFPNTHLTFSPTLYLVTYFPQILPFSNIYFSFICPFILSPLSSRLVFFQVSAT